MSPLYDDGSHDGRTHALVVGVGTYDHLDDPRVEEYELNPNLTSPPKSAVAFAEFIRDEYTNPYAALGSLDLLISPSTRYRAPHSDNATESLPATWENLETAVREWAARCDRNEGNIAIFYFCGHGIAVGRQLGLLASDFGDPARQQFANALNFTDTRWAMATSCKAKVQCFFADACRQVPRPALNVQNDLGQQPLDDYKTQNMAVDSFSLYASLPTDPAYGQTDGVAAFTSALLRSFRGLGSGSLTGQWWVTTSHLADGVETAMRLAQEHEGALSQTPARDGGSLQSFLHTIDDPGGIPVTIRLDPDWETDGAQLEITRPDTGATIAGPAGWDGPWHLELPVATYQGTAIFPRRWRNYAGNVTVSPPYVDTPWKLESCE